MKIGNLGKAIAFASLWFYAAYVSTALVSKGTETWEVGVFFVATAAFSVYVIFLFDSKPKKK